LETPNYKLERLKHDDPRLDNITASYKMAEEAEDVTAVTRRSQEPTNRQTPVIKGVLPDAPAPVAPPKPEPVAAAPVAPKAASVAAPAVAPSGFFGWIKTLFGGSAEPTPVASPAPAPVAKDDKRERPEGRGGRDGSRRNEPRGEGRGDRGPRTDRPPRGEGRGEGRNGNRGNRGERGQAGRDRSEPQAGNTAELNAVPEALVNTGAEAATTEQRTNRGRGGERGNRPERGERRPARNPAAENNTAPDSLNATPAAEAQTSSDNEQAPVNPGEAAPREKRSRDRYGRDRKPRGERNDAAAPTEAEAPAEVQNQEDAPRKSYFAQNAAAPRTETTEVSTEATSVAPADVAPTPVVLEAVSPVAVQEPVLPVSVAVVVPVAPAPTPSPATQAPAKLAPQIERYVLPLESLAGIAQQSGLTWVNSDTEKVAAVQATIAAEPKPARVPRERPVAVKLDDRPLVLVETRLDLKDIALPFENTQPG
jgi:ribonuclease E